MSFWFPKRNTGGEVGPRLRGDIGVFARELRYCVRGMRSALYGGMRDITEIARECRRIVLAAESELGPLPKASYLDLVADNIEDVSLADLKAALVVAGVDY